MICSVCGKDGAIESHGNGQYAHDWCNDALNSVRNDIIHYFTALGMLVSNDAIEKILSYPKLAMSYGWLEQTLSNALANSTARTHVGYISAEDVIIEVELSFSSI